MTVEEKLGLAFMIGAVAFIPIAVGSPLLWFVLAVWLIGNFLFVLNEKDNES